MKCEERCGGKEGTLVGGGIGDDKSEESRGGTADT